MTTLLTGGSGLLGRALLALDPSILAPTRAEMDVADAAAVRRAVLAARPALVIHAAAFTSDRAVRTDPAQAVRTNVVGTANVALAAMEAAARLVYVSTDYVYRGDRGMYREDDDLHPFNPYAWTKLGGECAVRLHPNHLIIRTTFGPGTFEYEEAFADKWTSKQPVSIAAPEILAAARSALTGVLHVGGERTTMFDYARRSRPEVRPVRLADRPGSCPPDTSLDLSRWRAHRGG